MMTLVDLPQLEPATQAPPGIKLTEVAAARLRDLLRERSLESHALRVFVSGGGCSGLQYGMAFEPEPRADDHRVSVEGLMVVIDPLSLGYMAGATIDYSEDLMGGGFRIDNPNAVASCGCGHSFRTQGNTAPAAAHDTGACGCH